MKLKVNKIKIRRHYNPRYQSGEVEIQLPDYDADVNLRLPNGQVVSLQWRVESPSMDVCLPTQTAVTNWRGDDMKPARPVAKQAHVRDAKQLVIDFDPEVLDE